jgi:hypothetical protein
LNFNEKHIRSFMKKLKLILFAMAFFGIVGWGPFSFFTHHSASSGSTTWSDDIARAVNIQASNLDPNVLKLGLKAYIKAKQEGYDHKGLLTIIDYTKESNERRLWVIDLNSDKVLFNTWVTHGKNSGVLKPIFFSNQPSTLKSSFGVFLTDGIPYSGNNGYSLRLRGLERGINDNAYQRAIVIHGAWYAAAEVVKKYGVLGRSWGCPAVDEKLARPLIDTIKNNTLVFIYAADQQWLRSSSFLV